MQNEHIHNVPERTFAVTTKDNPKHILRTGNIGPCVAFYGFNQNGVAFMSHLDGMFKNSSGLTMRLNELTQNDLSGFSLYFTTNYFLAVRFLVLLLTLGSYPYLHVGLWATLLLFVLIFGFWSIALVYIYSYVTFKTLRVQPKEPHGIWCRVEVSVDAGAKNGNILRDSSQKERDPCYAVPNVWVFRYVDCSPPTKDD